MDIQIIRYVDDIYFINRDHINYAVIEERNGKYIIKIYFNNSVIEIPQNSQNEAASLMMTLFNQSI